MSSGDGSPALDIVLWVSSFHTGHQQVQAGEAVALTVMARDDGSPMQRVAEKELER